ncbi:MAG: phosphotransferase [Desulfobulbaceae bacterium]|nr:phosphotransferase [Desulfobulbaceae bacterium]
MEQILLVLSDPRIILLYELLERNKLSPSDRHSIEKLAGDGSSRVFFRISQPEAPSLVAVFPDTFHPRGKEEAMAAYRIGRHLHSCSVPVPQIYAYDTESGVILFEDLGNIQLQSRVQEEPDKLIFWYEKTIDALLCLQISGRSGFPLESCWDTSRYDRQLMLERESGYFMQAFCRNFLGKRIPPGLTAEFNDLAGQAARQPADFILHRDFQSRNIMVHEGEIRIIDFQGARLGPLGYDLASLLIDPYVGLSSDEQEQLLDYYLGQAASRIDFDRADFLAGYYSLALQRNLQILGAFAFLSTKKSRHFFRKFIKPALCSLHHLLQHHVNHDYSVLARLVAEINKEI